MAGKAGWMGTQRGKRRRSRGLPTWITTTLVVVVLATWTVAVVISLVDPLRTIPAALNTAFLAVLGAVVGAQVGLGNRQDPGEDSVDD